MVAAPDRLAGLYFTDEERMCGYAQGGHTNEEIVFLDEQARRVREYEEDERHLDEEW